ncbi:MAG TPA: GAF domain-containing protein [Gemmataceae bacterium]|nr:GAF domain-containing protein [Gemmataceae bacterium]
MARERQSEGSENLSVAVCGARDEDTSDRSANEQAVNELRKALTLTATVSALAAPVSQPQLLEMIVQTAAQVLSARCGSLFLVDEDAQELTFEVAIGPKAEEAKKFRIPMGHGIAGLVAVQCQPLLISNAENDPRQASDVARAIGYWPRSIFCIPLMSGEKVIGVLELMDKEGASSFSPSDIEVLALFGNLAAVAIEQSRAQRGLTALLREALASLVGTPAGAGEEMLAGANAFVARLEQGDPAYRRALDLGKLVHEIVEQGENEFRACRMILLGFLDYLRSRAEPFNPIRGMR